MDIDLKQLREIMKAMKQLDVNELEFETEAHRLRLRRGAEPATMQVAPAMMPAAPASIPPPAPAPEPAKKAEAKADPNVVEITSTFVGTFYRAPSPDAPPFVEDGQKITPGQVLCIVEAMKLMNEIESEISGKIVEIIAENGKPVEFGDPLFKVKKSG